MKRWCFAFRVVPPEHTVLVRQGGSYFDAWYSQVLGQWYQVIPGGSLEKIPEPEMLFLDEEYARTHPKDFSKHPPRSGDLKLRRTKSVQTYLTFE